MQKYDVQCPSCCGTFHETRRNFDNTVPAHGAMFKLKDGPKKHGWSSFPEYDTTEYYDVCCPSCGAGYLDHNGRVIRLNATRVWNVPEIAKVVEEPGDEMSEGPEQEEAGDPDDGKQGCPICGKRLAKTWYKRHLREEHRLTEELAPINGGDENE